VGDMADSGYENIVCRLPGNLPALEVGGGQSHLLNFLEVERFPAPALASFLRSI
jgi:hypothetical protein